MLYIKEYENILHSYTEKKLW